MNKKEYDIVNLCKLSNDIYDKLSNVNKCLENKELFLSSDKDCQVYCCDNKGYITIVFRGTDSIMDVCAELNSLKTKFKLFNIDKNLPYVHSGIYEQFKSVMDDLITWICNRHKKNNVVSITLTGHSLGGALATLCSVYFGYFFYNVKINCITFGSPRVGDKRFGFYYRRIINISKRFVNNKDPITTIPPIFRFTHVSKPLYIGKIYNKSRFYRFLYSLRLSRINDHTINNYIESIKKYNNFLIYDKY